MMSLDFDPSSSSEFAYSPELASYPEPKPSSLEASLSPKEVVPASGALSLLKLPQEWVSWLWQDLGKIKESFLEQQLKDPKLAGLSDHRAYAKAADLALARGDSFSAQALYRLGIERYTQEEAGSLKSHALVYLHLQSAVLDHRQSHNQSVVDHLVVVKDLLGAAWEPKNEYEQTLAELWIRLAEDMVARADLAKGFALKAQSDAQGILAYQDLSADSAEAVCQGLLVGGAAMQGLSNPAAVQAYTKPTPWTIAAGLAIAGVVAMNTYFACRSVRRTTEEFFNISAEIRQGIMDFKQGLAAFSKRSVHSLFAVGSVGVLGVFAKHPLVAHIFSSFFLAFGPKAGDYTQKTLQDYMDGKGLALRPENFDYWGALKAWPEAFGLSRFGLGGLSFLGGAWGLRRPSVRLRQTSPNSSSRALVPSQPSTSLALNNPPAAGALSRTASGVGALARVGVMGSGPGDLDIPDLGELLPAVPDPAGSDLDLEEGGSTGGWAETEGVTESEGASETDGETDGEEEGWAARFNAVFPIFPDDQGRRPYTFIEKKWELAGENTGFFSATQQIIGLEEYDSGMFPPEVVARHINTTGDGVSYPGTVRELLDQADNYVITTFYGPAEPELAWFHDYLMSPSGQKGFNSLYRPFLSDLRVDERHANIQAITGIALSRSNKPGAANPESEMFEGLDQLRNLFGSLLSQAGVKGFEPAIPGSVIIDYDIPKLENQIDQVDQLMLQRMTFALWYVELTVSVLRRMIAAGESVSEATLKEKTFNIYFKKELQQRAQAQGFDGDLAIINYDSSVPQAEQDNEFFGHMAAGRLIIDDFSAQTDPASNLNAYRHGSFPHAVQALFMAEHVEDFVDLYRFMGRDRKIGSIIWARTFDSLEDGNGMGSPYLLTEDLGAFTPAILLN